MTDERTVEAILDDFEADAHEWLGQMNSAAERDRVDDDGEGGWGTPPAPARAVSKRQSPKGYAREQRQGKRLGSRGYAEMLLVEVKLARQALANGGASEAVRHALAAGHCHGAAYTLFVDWRDRIKQASTKGRAAKVALDEDRLRAEFQKFRNSNITRKAAAGQIARDGVDGIAISESAIKKRLQKMGAWE